MGNRNYFGIGFQQMMNGDQRREYGRCVGDDCVHDIEVMGLDEALDILFVAIGSV
ncbi:hypothetical protein [Nocardia jinanensis]|uniref:Uncharacterized protein n=1 Tax=Nocardia jinanensis TaxID=382504 RepID=A0A917RV41_9NOCA|nr:hypothetical protein [Nocardia jinanensis]GGL37711.1 hypothetical protein GCM10011588_60500 [Nocardia jinanensis]